MEPLAKKKIYITIDGKRFDTEVEATRHQIMCERIKRMNGFLETFYYQDMSISEVANELVENKEKIIEILSH